MDFFRFLRGPAMDMIGKFVQCSGLISSAVTLPLKGVMENVRNGQWVGPGADKFLAELSGERMPASQALTSQLATMHSNFMRSIDLVDQTDNRCKNQFTSFGDIASKIF